MDVIQLLLNEGAHVSVYDPIVESDQMHREFSDRKLDYLVNRFLTREKSAYDACESADAIVICTEWDEFAKLDYGKIYGKMRKPAFIFDGRMVVNSDELRSIGFQVRVIGKP